MKQLQHPSSSRIAAAAEEFVSEASDLYVDFLSEGRKALATSLFSGMVLALASLEQISRISPRVARTSDLRRSAALFHKLSLLIFLSAVRGEEGQESDLRTLRLYDTAADLSGLLAAAARRG